MWQGDQSKVRLGHSMRIEIIPKEKLNVEQTTYLRERVAADEHRFDSGPCHDWEMESLRSHLFIVLLKKSNQPIGILYRGGPKEATTMAWWLDYKFRGQLFGKEMVNLFAKILKEEGVTGIGQIVINTHQGRYNAASENLTRKLKAIFGSYDSK